MNGLGQKGIRIGCRDFLHRTDIFVVVLFAIFFTTSCANIIAPTGGDKDVTGPVLKNRNFSDSMLNVQGRKFEMEFDEFVQIKDAANQLVITPLMPIKPKFTAHKKKVTLEIPDSVLLPQTTYSIHLGKSIADLHESNPAEIPDIIFSTGTYFDSLYLQGSVWDSETGKPDTGSLILLYDATKPDSVIRTETPLYIQKSVGGLFSFRHLPKKQFKVFALGDKNNNLKYDGGAESIGFLKTDVASGDTSSEITLFSFLEKSSKNDSLAPKKTLNKTNPSKTLPFTYTVSADTSNPSKRTFELTDTLSISFSYSFSTMDIGKITLKQNNVIDATTYLKADSTHHQIQIRTDWLEDATYMLHLSEGFVQDSTGRSAQEGTYIFHTKRHSDYGSMLVKAEVNTHDWILLLSDKNLLQKIPMSDTALRFQLLKPGTYFLSILHDENGNGLYDAGSLREKRLPEIVDRIPREWVIKANWENTVDLRSINSTPNAGKR